MQYSGYFMCCVFVVLVSALPSVAQADTVQDILGRIPAPLTVGRAVAMDLETEAFVHRPRKDGSLDSRHIVATISYTRDGERVHSRRTSHVLDNNGNKRPNTLSTRLQLATEGMVVDAQEYEGRSYFGDANGDATELRKWASSEHDTGCFLSGLVAPDMFVPELLATDSKLRPDMEDIDGLPCYVIEGKTEQEEVVAWVCPEKGWNFLKYIVHKTGENTLEETPLKESGISDWTLTVDNIEIKKIGEEYVPVAGSITHSMAYDDGRRSEIRLSVKATSIDLAPDFDAMNAFRLDLPDGAVLNDDAGGLRYEVRNGGLVPYVDTRSVAALEQGVAAFLEAEKSSTPVADPAQTAVPAQSGQQSPFVTTRAWFRWAAVLMIVIGTAAIVLSVFRRRRKSSGTHT